jgi:hypothetical protein
MNELYIIKSYVYVCLHVHVMTVIPSNIYFDLGCDISTRINYHDTQVDHLDTQTGSLDTQFKGFADTLMILVVK